MPHYTRGEGGGAAPGPGIGRGDSSLDPGDDAPEEPDEGSDRSDIGADPGPGTGDSLGDGGRDDSDSRGTRDDDRSDIGADPGPGTGDSLGDAPDRDRGSRDDDRSDIVADPGPGTGDSLGDRDRSTGRDTQPDQRRDTTSDARDRGDVEADPGPGTGDSLGNDIGRGFTESFSEARQRQRRFADPTPRDERFGDLDVTFGLGGPGDDVERFLRQRSEEFQAFAEEDVQQFGESDRAAVRQRLEDTPFEGTLPSEEEAASAAATRSRFVSRLDPFAAGVGAIEAVEAGAFLAEPAVDTAVSAGEVAVGGTTEAELQTLESDFERTRRRGERFGRAAARAGVGVAEFAAENPGLFVEEVATGVAVGTAGGRAAGAAGRLARDRVRTAGSTELDLEDLTQEEVVRNVETGGAEGDRFPAAEDPELFREDPARAVREQAERQTTPEIEERFSEADAEGVTLQKALADEPVGPGRGRAARGFEAPEAESELAGQFESPGTFVGPDLSPNFLRVGAAERSFSLRPGLPDFGGRPTGALIRTEVEAPEADDLIEFNEELVERSGENTALTKPASEVNVGEIEAVLPPGSRFTDIGGSRTRSFLRRAGIGADFSVEVAGRQVPLRPVVPDADAPDIDEPLTGPSGRAFESRSLDELSRAPSRPVDRPGAVPTTPSFANESVPSGVGPSPSSPSETLVDISDGGLGPDDSGGSAASSGEIPGGDMGSVTSSASRPDSDIMPSRPAPTSAQPSMDSGFSTPSRPPSRPPSTTPSQSESDVTRPVSPPDSAPPSMAPPSRTTMPPSLSPTGPPMGPDPSMTPSPAPSRPPVFGSPEAPPQREFDPTDDDDRRRFRVELGEEFERDFTSSIADEESVISGDLDDLTGEPARASETRELGTRVTRVEGELPSGTSPEEAALLSGTEDL